MLLKLVSEVDTVLRCENSERWPEVAITLGGDVTEERKREYSEQRDHASDTQLVNYYM